MNRLSTSLLSRTRAGRNDFLSAFGALWFCSSAYLVCWSNFPAYTVGFAAMGMVAVHHLITTRTLRGALLAGLATGYATAGFLLQMYPPWMVPLAYTFAAALVGLFVRDRLWKQIIPRSLACGLGLAAVLAGVIVVVFFQAVQSYNRYAEIFYLQLPLGHPSAAFLLSHGYTQGSFAVAVAPDNPRLIKMGVRHALTFERDVYTKAPPCELVQESADKRFRVWNLPGATSVQ